MTQVCFFKRTGEQRLWCGFRISGHTGLNRSGQDILCAAISSAAYLTANTLTEVYRVNAEISVKDGFMSLTVGEKEIAAASPLLEGLRLHLCGLAQQYPKQLTVLISEAAI